jgi:hypothetical protein
MTSDGRRSRLPRGARGRRAPVDDRGRRLPPIDPAAPRRGGLDRRRDRIHGYLEQRSNGAGVSSDVERACSEQIGEGSHRRAPGRSGSCGRASRRASPIGRAAPSGRGRIRARGPTSKSRPGGCRVGYRPDRCPAGRGPGRLTADPREDVAHASRRLWQRCRLRTWSSKSPTSPRNSDRLDIAWARAAPGTG